MDVGGRRQCGWRENQIIAVDLNAPAGILMDQFLKILSQKMQKTLGRKASGIVLSARTRTFPAGVTESEAVMRDGTSITL